MCIIKLETNCNATEKRHIVISFAKSAKVLSEFHNLAAKYEKEYRPLLLFSDQEETEHNYRVNYRL